MTCCVAFSPCFANWGKQHDPAIVERSKDVCTLLGAMDCFKGVVLQKLAKKLLSGRARDDGIVTPSANGDFLLPEPPGGDSVLGCPIIQPLQESVIVCNGQVKHHRWVQSGRESRPTRSIHPD